MFQATVRGSEIIYRDAWLTQTRFLREVGMGCSCYTSAPCQCWRLASANAVPFSCLHNFTYYSVIQIGISPGKRLPRHGWIFLGAFLTSNPRVKQSVPL